MQASYISGKTEDLASAYQRRISPSRGAICKLSNPYERSGNQPGCISKGQRQTREAETELYEF